MSSANNIVFLRNTFLPNSIFNPRIKHFLAFEPSFVSDEPFFPCLSRFSSKVDGEALITIEVLDDDDSKLSDNLFTIANKVELRNEWDHLVINKCLCSYSRVVGISSESQDWGIYIDNIDFEIGLVGFESEEQVNLFLDIFKPELDVFESVKDYVEETYSILDFSSKTRKLYDAIVRNYTV